MHRWWVTLALTAALFAGCSDDAKPKADATPGVDVPEDIEVTEETGAIAGVVVDDAIRPLAGVPVSLLGASGANATTDENGQFQFGDLAPGPYALVAEHRLYDGGEVAIIVEAGLVSEVRITLTRNGVEAPYHQTLTMHGRSDPWLGFPSFAAEVIAPGSLGCTCAMNVTPGPGIQAFTLEATGTSDIDYSAIPVYGNLYWEFVAEPLQDGQDIRSAHGTFPVYEVFNRTDFDAAADDWLARITPSNYPHVSFDYDMYITLWYHELPPKGWSFVAGDP